ncbi:MAG: alpha/beta fold hydrolase [Acidobacteria bacterium]|nr:alpha/beta fold hydrolase [Acidobacteriota bacterium]
MGSGAPVVLLHGLGATWRVWQPILGELERHHDVLALTLPGHKGAPPWPGGQAVTAARLADVIESELDREGLGSVHAVGNSLGGWLALELARRGRALSVVAIAPIGLLTHVEIDRLVARLRAERAVASRIRRIARLLARSRIGRRLLFSSTVHRPADLSPEEARQWLDAYLGCTGFDAVLEGLRDSEPDPLPPRLACPVCVIWPEDDRLTPARPFAERFQTALPHAAHVRLTAAGHIPMSDAPRQMAAIILGHTGGTGD